MNRTFTQISLWIAATASAGMVFAQEASKAAPSSSGGIASLLPMMLIMFAVVYFLMIRPEQKKQKDRQAMLSTMKKGDRVITSSGILGTVGNVKDSTIMVKIAENTVVEFTKSAVTQIVNKDGTEKQAETPAEDKKSA
ncbi:MAG: preprotein translocase subunit YajC [Chitinispirillaceae bacterium]|nr:preprotein translocase subunit YajC [Chitinispirillaceae bacterium]